MIGKALSRPQASGLGAPTLSISHARLFTVLDLTMPPPLPHPVRELIIDWHYNDQLTVSEIAHRARCSESSVYRILQLEREFGLIINPNARTRGARQILDQSDKDSIKAFIERNPAAYLDEIQQHLLDTKNVWVSTSTISRTLAQMEITIKQISKTAAERDELVRAIWKGKHGRIAKENIVWLDESSVDDLTNQRLRGWAELGRACVRRDTFIRGQRYSILPALTIEGIIAFDIFEGSVTKERFIKYLRTHLVRCTCIK